MSFKLKHMKKISLLTISILLIFSFNTFSQDIKIGYTNVEYILSFLPETKQVQAEVQAYGTQLQNQLQSKITDFQSKAEVFQREAASMTEIIRADKQEELQNLQNSIEKFQREAQTAITTKETELFKPLFEKISNENYVFNLSFRIDTK